MEVCIFKSVNSNNFHLAGTVVSHALYKSGPTAFDDPLLVVRALCQFYKAKYGVILRR